jgi:hypothetical protein
MSLHSLTSGTPAPFCRMNYLHTSKGHGVAGPERFARGGDHVSPDRDGYLCTSSDNDPAPCGSPTAAITSG